MDAKWTNIVIFCYGVSLEVRRLNRQRSTASGAMLSRVLPDPPAEAANDE